MASKKYKAWKTLAFGAMIAAIVSFIRGDRESGIFYLAVSALWQGFAAEELR